MKQLQLKELIYIQDTGTLPDQASNEKKLFATHSIKSFAGYPIIIKKGRRIFRFRFHHQ
jgi:hypothetical protein